jgi:hypothetical protein
LNEDNGSLDPNDSSQDYENLIDSFNPEFFNEQDKWQGQTEDGQPIVIDPGEVRG